MYRKQYGCEFCHGRESICWPYTFVTPKFNHEHRGISVCRGSLLTEQFQVRRYESFYIY